MSSRTTAFRKSSAHAIFRHLAEARGLAAALVEDPDPSELGQRLARDGIEGVWVGTGSQKLDLRGKVQKTDLMSVLGDGVLLRPDPDPAEPPTEIRLRGETAQIGFFGTVLAMPKSVSILLAGTQEERVAVEAAAEAAAVAFMTTLEGLVRTRTGHGGTSSIKGHGLIGAQYLHRGSSDGDPHLHVHLLIANSTQGSDGKWRTLDTELFLADQRVATAAAMRAMQADLSGSLNLNPSAWTRGMVGSVPTPELVDLMPAAASLSRASTRLWGDRQVRGLGRTVSSGLDSALWRIDRAKNGASYEKIEAAVDLALVGGGLAAERLRADWHKLGGLDLHAGLAEFRGRRESPTVRRWGMEIKKPDSDRIKKHLLTRDTFILADVAALYAYYGLTAPDAQLASAELLDEMAAAGQIHMAVKAAETIKAMQSGEPVETRRARVVAGLHGKIVADPAMRAEMALAGKVEALARARGRPLAVAVPDSATNEQVQAIQLCARGRRLTAIQGVAGAGKSFILKPIAAAARTAGIEVLSLSRNAMTGRDLGSEIGAPGMSIAEFLGQNQAESSKFKLLIVDEAGLIDRSDFLELIALAEKPAARVQIIFAGDDGQKGSIDGRATFKTVFRGCAAAGQTTSLRTSYRNRAWAAEAAALREGNVLEVIAAATAAGRLHHSTTQDYAATAADLWQKSGGERLVVCQTNLESSRISQEIQKVKGIEPLVPVLHGAAAGVGDLIRTRVNSRRLSVYNGDRWTVVAALPGGALVGQNAAGRSVTFPADYVRESIELGYSTTIDSAQGKTAAGSIVIATPGMTREAAYSGATRGRASPIWLGVGDSLGAPEILAGILVKDGVAAELRDLVKQAETVAAELAQPHQLTTERNAVDGAHYGRVARNRDLWAAVRDAGGAEDPELHATMTRLRRCEDQVYAAEKSLVDRRQARENTRFVWHSRLAGVRAEAEYHTKRLTKIDDAIATPLPRGTLAAKQRHSDRLAALKAARATEIGLRDAAYATLAEIRAQVPEVFARLDQQDASDNAALRAALAKIEAEAAPNREIITNWLESQQHTEQRSRPSGFTPGMG